MLEVPVYNTDGEKIDALQVDEGVFGGRLNTSLLKQAIVAYHANRRRGTASTRGRGEVSGSTKKLFRQKGTGNARRGPRRTCVLRGGGNAFGKKHRDFGKKLPTKMRRAARDSAILAKMLGGDILVLEGLSISEPRTREMAAVMRNLKIQRSCLLALAGPDENIYLSSRNIPDLTVRVARELNAFDVATRMKLIVTSEAMQLLLAGGGGRS